MSVTKLNTRTGAKELDITSLLTCACCRWGPGEARCATGLNTVELGVVRLGVRRA